MSLNDLRREAAMYALQYWLSEQIEDGPIREYLVGLMEADHAPPEETQPAFRIEITPEDRVRLTCAAGVGRGESWTLSFPMGTAQKLSTAPYTPLVSEEEAQEAEQIAAAENAPETLPEPAEAEEDAPEPEPAEVSSTPQESVPKRGWAGSGSTHRRHWNASGQGRSSRRRHDERRQRTGALRRQRSGRSRAETAESAMAGRNHGHRRQRCGLRRPGRED